MSPTVQGLACCAMEEEGVIKLAVGLCQTRAIIRYVLQKGIETSHPSVFASFFVCTGVFPSAH